MAVARRTARPVGNPPARGSGSEMAHKSKKLAVEVLRRSGAFFRANTSGDVISAMVGATIGVVGSAFGGLGLGARAVAIDGKISARALADRIIDAASAVVRRSRVVDDFMSYSSVPYIILIQAMQACAIAGIF